MKQKIQKFYLFLPAILYIAARSSHFYLNGTFGVIIGVALALANIFGIFMFRKKIVCPAISLILFILFFLMAKSQSELSFAVTMVLGITIVFFKKAQVVVTAVASFLFLFFSPLLFFTLLIILPVLDGSDMIYPETHYYTDDGRELFVYSAGAMDGFHYCVGRGFEIIDLGQTLKFYYRDVQSVNKHEYEQVKGTANCTLAD